MELSPVHQMSPESAHTPRTSTPVRGNYDAKDSYVSSESLDSVSLEVFSDIEGDRTTCEEEPRSDLAPVLENPIPAIRTNLLSLDHTISQQLQIKSAIAGYKMVFDNLDTTVKHRHMTAGSQTLSLHYVQGYAVRDRVDYSRLPGQRCGGTNLYDILPTSSEYCSLKENFTVHVCRVITDNLAFFREDFKGLAPEHLSHKYSSEHSKKSEVVSYSSCMHWVLCCILRGGSKKKRKGGGGGGGGGLSLLGAHEIIILPQVRGRNLVVGLVGGYAHCSTRGICCLWSLSLAWVLVHLVTNIFLQKYRFEQRLLLVP